MAEVLLSSGRGPVECEIAVGLYLERFCREHSGAVVLREQRGRVVIADKRRFVPYKSVVVSVPDGRKVETGVVQWICRSPVRKSHRRKNWFIEVIPLTDAGVPPELDEKAIEAEMCFETFRSPGKGGQNVNKVETGARAVHVPTGLSAHSVTARTQLANKKLAAARLLAMVRERNAEREGAMAEAEWRNHDQLERGNPFAVFSGPDFIASHPK